MSMCTQAAEEALEGYGVAGQDMGALQARLGAHAGGRLEAAVREAANTALPRMKERFTEASGSPALFARLLCIGVALEPRGFQGVG